MSQQDIAAVDAWVTQLLACKQLNENEVKMLCEKVHSHTFSAMRSLHDIERLWSARYIVIAIKA